jgi:hypothetical protein
MSEDRSPSPEPGDEQADEAGLDAAPEGASTQARPDVEETGEDQGASGQGESDPGAGAG